jgi:hypothetical protein
MLGGRALPAFRKAKDHVTSVRKDPRGRTPVLESQERYQLSGSHHRRRNSKKIGPADAQSGPSDGVQRGRKRKPIHFQCG